MARIAEPVTPPIIPPPSVGPETVAHGSDPPADPASGADTEREGAPGPAAAAETGDGAPSGPQGSDGPGSAPGAGGGDVGGPAEGGAPGYAALVQAWLERHKRYPTAARQRGVEGVVVMSFTIAVDGTVLSQRVDAGSGSHMLDRAAEDMVQRASPLPPVPPAFGVDRLTLTVPIAFSLR